MMNRKVVNPMNKARPKTMLIRLSEEEYNQVKQDIESSGMNQQDWLLSKVMKIIKNDIVTKDGKESK